MLHPLFSEKAERKDSVNRETFLPGHSSKQV